MSSPDKSVPDVDTDETDSNSFEGPDVETSSTDEKSNGLGTDGTIPNNPDGLAAGHTGAASTFEPEEDEQS